MKRWITCGEERVWRMQGPRAVREVLGGEPFSSIEGDVCGTVILSLDRSAGVKIAPTQILHELDSQRQRFGDGSVSGSSWHVT